MLVRPCSSFCCLVSKVKVFSDTVYEQDSSLELVALGARALNRTIFKGNPYEHPVASAEYRGMRPTSMSVTSDAAHSLDPPPLSVLLNPDHIVVCSFLGEESLTSLQWLLLPLRAAHAPTHPPITILHAGEPSQAFIYAVSPFQDVVSLCSSCIAACCRR
jgi:hypothetical protein